MAFILNSAINSDYNQCVKLLNELDEVQIETVYSFITLLNSQSNTYKMISFSSRSSILHYLIKLKDNENECDPNMVFKRFHDILIFMSAVSLLKINYEKKYPEFKELLASNDVTF